MENSIIEKLKQKNLSDSSIKLYMKILKNLNDKKEIKNFKFLLKPQVILDKIKGYKETTQRNVIISIVSVLKALESDLYKTYYDIMINMTKKINENNLNNEKSDKQKENWMEWEDVEKLFNELKKNLKVSKKATEEQYDNLLNLVVLSLYVLLPPRRNADYLEMDITKDKTEDKNKNYLDLKKKQFVFNVFKTSKKDGQLVVNIPDELMELLKIYIKHHPHKMLLKKENIPFLVYFDGKKVKENGITRILNKIFNKKIGSSMLRHIYLSSKYGDVLKEQKNDAKMMSHNIQTQKDYIKK